MNDEFIKPDSSGAINYEIDYKNLNGLLILCMAAGMVTVEQKEKTWKITRAFSKILDKRLEAHFDD